MRLTCPNCGAEYDVPDGMIPAGRPARAVHAPATPAGSSAARRRGGAERGADPHPARDLAPRRGARPPRPADGRRRAGRRPRRARRPSRRRRGRAAASGGPGRRGPRPAEAAPASRPAAAAARRRTRRPSRPPPRPVRAPRLRPRRRRRRRRRSPSDRRRRPPRSRFGRGLLARAACSSALALARLPPTGAAIAAPGAGRRARRSTPTPTAVDGLRDGPRGRLATAPAPPRRS